MTGSASVALALALFGAQAPPAEFIARIQVHGNLLTPEDEIVRLADVRIGMPFEAATPEAVAARLRATGRFVSVEVLKRFASIADLSQVLLVIIVDDGRVEVDWETGDVRAPGGLLGRGPRLMFMPLLKREDGYGFSYGVQLAVPDPVGPRSRLAFPLTWGGEKTAGLELEKSFERGPFTRLEAGASVSRRENPFYELNDDRRRMWLEAERQFARPLRAGISAGWQRVSFDEARDTFGTVGAHVVVDTRIDPFLSPNAIMARAGWERFGFDPRAVEISSLEAEGHAGLFGQTVLVARARRDDSSGPLPRYQKPLAGGMDNLRGFHAGWAAGDTLVAGTFELRAPLTSPLSVGKLGVSGFLDLAAAYDDGARLRDQRFERGVGASAWLAAAVFRLELSVARGLRHGTRAHFGASTSF